MKISNKNTYRHLIGIYIMRNKVCKDRSFHLRFNRVDWGYSWGYTGGAMQILDVDQIVHQNASSSAPSRNKNRNQVLHTRIRIHAPVNTQIPN